MKCPFCESSQITTRDEIETFRYGIEKPVDLTVTIPVHSCGQCGKRFTDAASDDIRDEAIARHINAEGP